jgi:predicted Zn-dependent protease
MQGYFYTLAERLCAGLHPGERLNLDYAGEESDFVRFNHARVRQAGRVRQAAVGLDLITGARHATLDYELQHDLDTDLARLQAELGTLRECLPRLPEDPHLLCADEIRQLEHLDPQPAPDARALTAEIADAARGLDLVGVLASGPLEYGFANSLGQRNWHRVNSFNLDWSCYLAGDKAVKADYAGRRWDEEGFRRQVERVRGELTVMARPPLMLKPGRYRAYLAPTALREILDLLSWEGFGLKAHRSAETPLLRMVREHARLHPAVNLSEDAGAGLAPRFTPEGFIKRERVELIRAGCYAECLVGPRSAREFGVPLTGEETPQSLDLASGRLPLEDVAATLGTGLWINNLWYCNFSDHDSCRITGMTRFACLWVERGEVVAPVQVMRFDDTVYHILGEGLEGLTRERELLLDGDTYDGRSSASWRLPGVLVDGLRLTL